MCKWRINNRSTKLKRSKYAPSACHSIVGTRTPRTRWKAREGKRLAGTPCLLRLFAKRRNLEEKKNYRRFITHSESTQLTGVCVNGVRARVWVYANEHGEKRIGFREFMPPSPRRLKTMCECVSLRSFLSTSRARTHTSSPPSTRYCAHFKFWICRALKKASEKNE